MQKKHMERCLFALIVLLIFALTIFGLYRVTKHSAAPASTTIPAASPATSPADVPTATSSPTPEPAPSPTPTPPDRGFLCCARHRSRVASVGYDALAD